jgi:predicted nucleotidyltransferase
MDRTILQGRRSIRECLTEITDIVVNEFHPERIILFGSQARGDADERSDVDLLIVMPDEVDRRQTAVAIRRAIADVPVAADVVVTTPGEIARRGDLVGTVLRPALREGEALYRRQ